MFECDLIQVSELMMLLTSRIHKALYIPSRRLVLLDSGPKDMCELSSFRTKYASSVVP